MWSGVSHLSLSPSLSLSLALTRVQLSQEGVGSERQELLLDFCLIHMDWHVVHVAWAAIPLPLPSLAVGPSGGVRPQPASPPLVSHQHCFCYAAL
jgi:hypothetical protein